MITIFDIFGCTFHEFYDLFISWKKLITIFVTSQRKKTLAQEVRQKSDVSNRRSIRPLQPLLCLQHVQLCYCATCKGLTPKMNIAFPIRNLMLNIFLFNNFFQKKNYFQRKPKKKLFWGPILQFFKERRRLTPKINITFLSQIRYWIFYDLPIFSKKCVIFWENAKKPFLGSKSFLKDRRRLTTRMNITFFMGNEILNVL